MTLMTLRSLLKIEIIKKSYTHFSKYYINANLEYVK